MRGVEEASEDLETLSGAMLAEPIGPWEQALQLVEAGGPVVLILLALSVLALAVVLLKL